MEDQVGLVNLDNLLVQLALEARELAQKKNDLTQQCQICEAGIQEKKEWIQSTQKTIKKLEEDIQQTENTIRCYKTNVKSLRGSSDLLIQYEKMLEAELERRQESYNQDTKMFQERMENYRKIFQQYKEEYLQNPLATKLLKIQGENEEIERRIRVLEEEITAKEKELKALQEHNGTGYSVPKQVESNEQQASPSEDDTQTEADQTDPQAQDAKSEQQDVKIAMVEKVPENRDQEQADGGDESNSSEVGEIGSTVWANSEIRGEHSQGAEQKEQEHPAEVDMNMNTSTWSDTLEKMMEAEEQQEYAEATAEEGGNERAVCPPSSPVHMSVLDTPTFCLSGSPGTSQGHQAGGGTPAFVFSMNSGPNTPTFLGFDFEVSPSQQEESPFSFSSSYFSKVPCAFRKSPETKLPGFLFDESHTHEDFAFSFSSESPQSKEPVATGDPFPFSVNFGKY